MDPIKPPSEPVPPPTSSNNLPSGVADEQQFDRRTAANRRNAQKSTGPRTPEGKKRSASNSTKFGVFSCKALVPGETWEDFLEFQEQLIQALRPATKLQEHLAQQYCILCWRMRRLFEAEAFSFERLGLSHQENQCGPSFALLNSMQEDDVLGRLAGYSAMLSNHSVKWLQLFRAVQKADLSSQPIIDIPAAPDLGELPSG